MNPLALRLPVPASHVDSGRMSEASITPEFSRATLSPPFRKGTAARTSLIGILLIVIGYSPMLYLHGETLWSREHYQFFPLLLAGVVLLFISRRSFLHGVPREPLAEKRWPMRINAMVFAVSLATFVLSLVINSPMFAAASAILTTGCLLHRAFGWSQSGAWVPPWMLLWLVVPPPNNLDYQLITWLQRQTATAASLCLDVLGYDHLMTGVILEVPNAKFFVDEACSGVHSLLALLAATCLFVVWGRRPALQAMGLLVAAMCWSGFGNILRIVTITVAFKQWEIDLTTGWQHDVLGMCTFAISFLLLLSTDRFLHAFLSPIEADEDNPSRIGQLWNRWIAGTWLPGGPTEDPDDQDMEIAPSTATSIGESDKATTTTFRLTRLGWIFAVCVAVLGGTQLAVLASNPELNSSHTRSFLALYEEIKRDALPEKQSNWKWVDYGVEHRQWDNFMGRCSQIWKYSSPYGPAHVALDYPFVGDHDLSICYSNQGWEVAGETRHNVELDDSQAPFIEVHLRKHSGEHGLLFYTVFDTDGQSLNRPKNEFWRFLVYRVERSPLFNAAESKGLWKRIERIESYQFQMFVPTNGPLTAEQRDEARQRFVDMRTKIVHAFIDAKDNATRVDTDS